MLATIFWALYLFNTDFAHFHLQRANRKSLLEELDSEDEIADGVEIEHIAMKKRYIETYKAVMYMADSGYPPSFIYSTLNNIPDIYYKNSFVLQLVQIYELLL